MTEIYVLLGVAAVLAVVKALLGRSEQRDRDRRRTDEVDRIQRQFNEPKNKT